MTAKPRPTNEELFGILTTALEGGYAEEFEVLDYTRRDSDSVIIKARLHCSDHDVEGVDTWDITPARMRQGLERWYEWQKANDPEHKTYLGEQYAEGARDGWDCLDAIGADAVLQFACFGEIVFV